MNTVIALAVAMLVIICGYTGSLDGFALLHIYKGQPTMKRGKTDQPKVSIIVVANQDSGIDLVFDLLRSFYPQAGGISFEFIVFF